MSYINLECIKYKSKLRVRFHSYVDENNKRYLNAYNKEYNCRFPKNLRKEGYYYKIPANSLTITSRKDCIPFYSVNKKNIQIVHELTVINIYKVEDCIICMENMPNVTLAPCGHHCTCEACYNILRTKPGNWCPICRREICKAYLNNS